MFRFDTMSDAERLRRWANKRKFYATLSEKLDAEVSRVIEEREELEKPYTVVITEEENGETLLGGEIRKRIVFKKDNTFN